MKRLTTPEELRSVGRLFPTGNHLVSLPVVDAADASLSRVGVLHHGLASLIEFGGVEAELGAESGPARAPFLRPLLLADGREITLEGRLTWRRLADWVPRFVWTDSSSGVSGQGTVFAPVFRDSQGLQSHRGFVYVLEITQFGARSAGLRMGLRLTWGDLIQTIYTSRRLPADFTVRGDRWTGGPVLEPRSGHGVGPAAMAVAFSASTPEVQWSQTARADNRISLEMTVRLRPDAPATAFYFGCGREGDGARTVAVDLSRRGWETLLGETTNILGRLHRPVTVYSPGPSATATASGVPPVHPPDPGALSAAATASATSLAPREAAVLEQRLNENLLFNYFFAVGRTIDTEELVLVTSRSPRYYVSAAFWARDALLWSLPGLLLTDPQLAEQAVGEAFSRYFRHVGVHSLYMDGRLLYPGFELDELAAYPIALWRYVAATGDRGILARRGLVGCLERVLTLLADQRHPDPDVNLYRTFLLPSDDPATHPYVTYDNVLVWRALLATADLAEWAGAAEVADKRPADLRAVAALVRESIFRHFVLPGRQGPMFAWSADLAGEAEVGDEPPGSLELLTYYGFCAPDNEVWLNTMAWLHSRDNPYRYVGVPFPGLGCPHAQHPFVMSLFNALLGGLPWRVVEAAEVLTRAPLDTGLACESFDRQTGEVKTGAAFATCAGFLGYALDRVFGIGARVDTGTGPWAWNT